MFQLVQGDYNKINRQLNRDEVLPGYFKDKIRRVCSKPVGMAANNRTQSSMITTEKHIASSFVCKREYTSCSLIELRT
jgi:hypothetical protein